MNQESNQTRHPCANPGCGHTVLRVDDLCSECTSILGAVDRGAPDIAATQARIEELHREEEIPWDLQILLREF